ncbi:4-diphosphocytidyl-2-C-methyl-D-erythritol kinase, chloroplastic/chromoplastic [Vitis vinifera]|uniref:4-diphosphocytidyl-2-C-methyl-D-erythritol kinase, chloroplastic/chromoplastic n=1 Tax=Vitis vinifera TaxID=29760 RepID=A0A438CYA4_VITVI|nr:4-diphosphocytidyl-2-C-methyl-D-erythritol kinase, chloroplastic/chromoplastic [Vitis vinifera]
MAMASSQFFCDHQLHPSCNSIRRTTLPSFRPHGSSSFRPKPQFQRTPFLRVRASAGRKQVEIVYNPDERINNLADEVDKNTGLSRLTLFSPCKINVFLRITGKRADGFHDLASLFHIIKALNLYRKKTGTDNYFWVHLDKKVPTGQGLVVAAVMLQQHCGQQINLVVALPLRRNSNNGQVRLVRIFHSSSLMEQLFVLAEVVEDISLPIPLDIPMVLVKPPQACSTAEVYKHLRLDQTSKVDPITLLEKISKNGISQDVCINDLEPPAFEVLPSLKRLKQRIIAASRGQYDAVFMSGSCSKSSSQTKRLETILST